MVVGAGVGAGVVVGAGVGAGVVVGAKVVAVSSFRNATAFLAAMVLVQDVLT